MMFMSSSFSEWKCASGVEQLIKMRFGNNTNLIGKSGEQRRLRITKKSQNRRILFV